MSPTDQTSCLLQPDRLEEVLSSGLDRRQKRAERRREHVVELNKRAAETDLRLKRLYDTIEAGVASLDDPALLDLAPATGRAFELQRVK